MIQYLLEYGLEFKVHALILTQTAHTMRHIFLLPDKLLAKLRLIMKCRCFIKEIYYNIKVIVLD